MTRSRGWCAAALAVLLLTAVPSLARADSGLPRPTLAGLTSALGDLWQTLRAWLEPAGFTAEDADRGHEMDPNGLQAVPGDSGHGMDPDGLQGDPDRGHGMDPNG